MKLKRYFYSLAGAALMLFGMTACSPDEYDLGDKDVTSADLVEGTAYSITHDENNPNIVYLKSLMSDRYQVSWIEPQGRSQSKEVTLQIPFPGTYDVLFGVNTRGGVVYGDTAHFTIDNFYAGFVDNELYNNLTGGVGNTKTWIPDNGKYGLASGDISYGDPSLTLDWNNFTPNWEPEGNHQDETGNHCKNSYWTFDLNNGANVHTHTVAADGTATDADGTFLIDETNHRLNLTDAELLHSPNWSNREDATGWAKDIRIVTLTENQLRLGVLRNPDTSGEGEWWLVFNFVSKDYADNYVAPEEEYAPKLESGWRNFVEPVNDKLVTYKFTGFDWYDRDANTTEKNVEGIDAVDNIEDITIQLNSGNNSYTFTDASGNQTTGSYTLSDDGIYTFTPALPTITLSKDGRAVLTSNESQLRILGFTQAANCNAQTGALDNIVWGVREYDDQGHFYQYLGYKLSVVRAGVTKTYPSSLHLFTDGWAATPASEEVYITDGVDADYTYTISGAYSPVYGIYLDLGKILGDHPNLDVVIKDIKVDGTSITFDDTAIDRGTGDTYSPGTTCARRYIVNPWGATAGEASKYNCTSSVEVTVSVKMDNGTPFITSTEAKKHRR